MKQVISHRFFSHPDVLFAKTSESWKVNSVMSTLWLDQADQRKSFRHMSRLSLLEVKGCKKNLGCVFHNIHRNAQLSDGCPRHYYRVEGLEFCDNIIKHHF